MSSLSRDTSPDAQQVLLTMLREAPASKKLALTFELIQATRLLVSAGIQRRFPSAGEEELRRYLVAKLLPRDDVIKAYGFDPHNLTR
jgi:hypothetical protein